MCLLSGRSLCQFTQNCLVHGCGLVCVASLGFSPAEAALRGAYLHGARPALTAPQLLRQLNLAQVVPTAAP